MKLTPWYPPEIKPLHVGVYERDYSQKGRWYCFWDGNYFGCAQSQTIFCTEDVSLDQNIPWRGLTSKAKP